MSDIKPWHDIVVDLLSIINTGIVGPPDHICGGPDSRCDCLCSNYADQCRILTKAEKLLKEYHASH